MEEFKKYPVGLFLATTSSEDFQSYRIYNSILFLHRNGVDLSPVFYTCSFVSMQISAVYLYTGRKNTHQMTSIITHYSSAIYSLLGNNLKILPLEPFCFQQMVYSFSSKEYDYQIFITPRGNVKDVIYQLDSIYLKKLVYKGKPKYPIPPRRNNILVNFRKEAPKWANEQPVRQFFDEIYKVLIQRDLIIIRESV